MSVRAELGRAALAPALRTVPGIVEVNSFGGDRRQLFLHSNDNYSCRAGAGLMERHGDQRAFRIGLG